MTTGRRRLLGAAALLGAIGATAGILAGGGSASLASTQADVVRLTATLTPTSTASTGSGSWQGVLVFRGARSGRPAINVPCFKFPKGFTPKKPLRCGQIAPARPGTSAHWIVAWRLTYQQLSSTVTGADIRVAATPGAAPTIAANLCKTCVPGKVQLTNLTDAQANAVLAGRGSVVVQTVSAPDGALSGAIVKASLSATHHS